MSHPREVTSTSYEWDYEYLDEHGDIIDHDFSDKCPGFPTEPRTDFLLVKNVARGLAGDEMSFDLDYRAYAYIKDGHLPETFDDGSKVPQRFHKELARKMK